MQHPSAKFHAILHSAELLEEKLRHRLKHLDVRPRQARVLDALARIGAASQSELAREFNLTAASMSTMINRLLAAGYITRDDHPEEARSYVVQLSQKGHDILTEIHDAWSDIDAFIEEAIGGDRAEHMVDLTSELREALIGFMAGAKG